MMFRTTILLLACAACCILAVTAQEDFCNICGQGNTIQFPTGVVTFVYKDGKTFKNNCNTWQRIVMNPNAISDEFCRNELLEYTHDTCRCTDPFGNQVQFVAPTVSPAPGGPGARNSHDVFNAKSGSSMSSTLLLRLSVASAALSILFLLE